MTDREQNWTEHLSELRVRILWVLTAFVTTLIIGLVFARPIIHFLKEDILEGALGEQLELNIFSPGEALSIYMQFAFVVAVTLTLPVALYQAWCFVQPGLMPRERKATLSYIPLAVILFLLGLCFGYYWIFPFLLRFMSSLSASLGATETYGMYEFFRFLFRVVFPIAFLFELPVLILFLTRLRILKPDLLRKGRRFAYLVLVVVAALVTPPDFVSNILVTLPLILLYEFSILLSARIYRRMKAEEEAEERRWAEKEGRLPSSD
ncbi:twin-arginine translocase subunit TatC [Paludifilum halophilum]|uniref:Sec-independent protein translocase protein TatC n=1 Tax=Paludifilum halophilum TaxID=1642702 RepID=A0A235B354_9BACL|nr:twin-arginine translocase subunit TatC [Paludifilum halophilum]OYD06714.1 twin-arginine translocase subunit TatC [Paludifilum halophilum]